MNEAVVSALTLAGFQPTNVTPQEPSPINEIEQKYYQAKHPRSEALTTDEISKLPGSSVEAIVAAGNKRAARAAKRVKLKGR